MTAKFTVEIEFEVDGDYTPYVPATWDNPAEGDYVENLALTRMGIVRWDPLKREHVTKWLKIPFFDSVSDAILANSDTEEMASDAVREDRR